MWSLTIHQYIKISLCVFPFLCVLACEWGHLETYLRDANQIEGNDIVVDGESEWCEWTWNCVGALWCFHCHRDKHSAPVAALVSVGESSQEVGSFYLEAFCITVLSELCHCLCFHPFSRLAIIAQFSIKLPTLLVIAWTNWTPQLVNRSPQLSPVVRLISLDLIVVFHLSVESTPAYGVQFHQRLSKEFTFLHKCHFTLKNNWEWYLFGGKKRTFFTLSQFDLHCSSYQKEVT